MNKYQQEYKASLQKKKLEEERLQASLSAYSSDLINDLNKHFSFYIRRFKEQQYKTADVNIYLYLSLIHFSSEKIKAYKTILEQSGISFVEKKEGGMDHHLFITLNKKVDGKRGEAGDLTIVRSGDLSLVNSEDYADAESYAGNGFFKVEEPKALKIKSLDEIFYKIGQAFLLTISSALFVLTIAMAAPIFSGLIFDIGSYMFYFFGRIIENIKLFGAGIFVIFAKSVFLTGCFYLVGSICGPIHGSGDDFF
jgi:hypothetical protein